MYDYSSSEAILGTPAGSGGGSPVSDNKVKVDGSDTIGDYLAAKLQAGDSIISFQVTNPGGNEVLETVVSISALIDALTGNFIRNLPDFTEEDSPGNISLADLAKIIINNAGAATEDKAEFGQGRILIGSDAGENAFAAFKNSHILKYRNMAAGFDETASCVTYVGQELSKTIWEKRFGDATTMQGFDIGMRSANYFCGSDPANAKFFPFSVSGSAVGYAFPRVKLKISATDTVADELGFKFVDSNGQPFPEVTNGSHGKALQIPGTAGGVNPSTVSAKTMDRALCVSSLACTTPSSGSVSAYLTSFVPDSDTPLSIGQILRFVATQLGGGQYAASIYDGNLNLLARTQTQTISSLGQVTLPIDYIAPGITKVSGGTVYYVGLHHNGNSPNFGGIAASTTMNGAPGTSFPAIAWKVDNIATIQPPATLSGGSETLIRLYARIG